MTSALLLWGDSLIAVAALIGVIRLNRAQRHSARELQLKLAVLARLIQSSRTRITLVPTSPTPQVGDLSFQEIRALSQLKQRADFDPFERIVTDREPRRESES